MGLGPDGWESWVGQKKSKPGRVKGSEKAEEERSERASLPSAEILSLRANVHFALINPPSPSIDLSPSPETPGIMIPEMYVSKPIRIN